MIKLILKGSKTMNYIRINLKSLLVNRQNDNTSPGLGRGRLALALTAAEANRMYYSMAEMSVAEMSVGQNFRGQNVLAKCPWPKCPWPKCPSTVSPWVRNSCITHVISPKHWLNRMSHNFVVKRHHNNVKMMSNFLKLADVNAEYSNIRVKIFKHSAQKNGRKRMQHKFEERIDKSFPRVTVWHHEAAKQ